VRAPALATVRAAVQSALTDAEVEPGDLSAMVLPAYGLPAVDRVLLEAVDQLPALERVPALSWRGATGHTALADDLVALVVATAGMKAGRLPGTVGCREPLAIGGRAIATSAIETTGKGVLLVGAGLWGQATATVLGR